MTVDGGIVEPSADPAREGVGGGSVEARSSSPLLLPRILREKKDLPPEEDRDFWSAEVLEGMMVPESYIPPPTGDSPAKRPIQGRVAGGGQRMT